MDTISPPEASLKASVHAIKHRVNSSGSRRLSEKASVE
jgi:hypothetical protein